MINNETVHIAGIDLPKQLYKAAEDGTLVIFVGAGVSKESQVPDFNELTAEILKDAEKDYESKNLEEKRSPSEKLERAELDGIDIRRETKSIIEDKNKGYAYTHSCLLDFFSNETIRLVTTNFDLNLTEAAKKKKIKHKSYRQPALPTGDSFDGIVYLHGSIEEDDNHLIITEKDFARAYLKYGRQTAFIRELFSQFTVLFIGYSYEDKIFQFLTKSDDFQSTRYVFVPDTDYQEDPQKWDVLNLTAVPYNTNENHKQLWQVMKIWGDLINFKPSEHQIEIKRIAKKRGVISLQESDYIKCCLEKKNLARCFSLHATSEKWLKWAYENGLLDTFFKIELNPSETDQQMFVWFSDNFVTKNYNLSLEIIEKAIVQRNSNALNTYLVDMIALAFHRTKKLPPRPIFGKWMHIILSYANFLSKDYISYILLKCRLPQDSDIAILLLSKLTSPDTIRDRGRSDSTQHWIKDIWEKKFKPKMAHVAFEVEPLIIHNLKLYELREKTKYNLNVASYISRPAIEEHENNHKHELSDVLIDIARDIIDYLVEKHPELAKETIQRWYKQKTIILKRLSLYGMARHKKIDSSKKLSWLFSKKEILHPALRHENFSLIKEIYPKLNEEQKLKLISAAEKEEQEKYPIYNFIVWLNRSDRSCSIAKVKLDKLQQQNPDFGAREKPDLASHMSTGWVGYISPISVEDLMKMDLAFAVKKLDIYKGEGGFGKPEREGLIDTLGDAVKKDFNWSLSLAKKLVAKNVWHDDIWQKIISSWSDIQNLSKSDALQVVNLILSNKKIHLHHYCIARFLCAKEKDLYTNNNDEKQVIKLVYAIRDIAFDDENVGKIIINEGIPDWWTEAINSTGHYISIFLLRLFDKKYKKTKGKLAKLDDFFQPFIQGKSFSAQMGRTTLTHDLHYLFNANKKWTREFILPLFDWTLDTTNALQSWQAYLYRGSWNKDLFEDLIALHKKTFVHFKGLGSLRENYCQHVAGLTLYSIIFDKHDPLETGWLRAFIKHCEEEDLESFAEGVNAFLKDNKEVQKNSDSVWERLLKPYLDQRISGKPKIICKLEFRWMLKWCLSLDKSFAACVNKLIEADKAIDLLGINQSQRADIFYRFKETEAFKKHPNDAGKFVLHLLSKRHIASWDENHLKETIGILESSGCNSKMISEIKEAAINIGFSIED